MFFVQKHVSSSFESVLWSNYNISKSCFQLLLGICVSYFENENWRVSRGRDSFKVVSPSRGMGKSSFRKTWPVGFVYTIPLLFCVYICTSIDFDEFLSCFGFSFRPKTTDLIIENTYFYYRKWWNPGFGPFLTHFLGETTPSDGG